MKNQELYGRCQCCGSAIERSNLFIKIYSKTEICLCKNCAEDLQCELNEYGVGGEQG